jgi:hypothetical protein
MNDTTMAPARRNPAAYARRTARPPDRAAGRIVLSALLLSLGLLSACDAGVTPTNPLSTAESLHAEGSPDAEVEREVFVFELDGSLRSLSEHTGILTLTSAGENRVAALVTGSGTFSHSSVRELRLNARQTAEGGTTGRGRVTLYSPISGLTHTSDFEAICIKPISGWGRTNIGVTVELDEPFLPYGSIPFTHVALSITADGQLDPLVMNTRPFCGGTITFVPPQNLLEGRITVVLPK